MTDLANDVCPSYFDDDIFAGVCPELKRVPPDLCDRGEFQTRNDFDPDHMIELTTSIKNTGGNIMPVILRPKMAGTRYEIIAGERRVRASIDADTLVLSLIANYTDHQAATIALIENVQRENLNPIEEANGYQSMIDELGLKQREVADLTGKSRSHVANFLRLLKLDLRVKDSLSAGRIDVGHAKLLVGLPTQTQRDLTSKITLNQWSVRALETHLKKMGQKAAPPPSPHHEDKDVANLEHSLSEHIGFPVRIFTDKYGNKGELRIHFWSSDEFENIEEILRGRQGRRS